MFVQILAFAVQGLPAGAVSDSLFVDSPFAQSFCSSPVVDVSAESYVFSMEEGYVFEKTFSLTSLIPLSRMTSVPFDFSFSAAFSPSRMWRFRGFLSHLFEPSWGLLGFWAGAGAGFPVAGFGESGAAVFEVPFGAIVNPGRVSLKWFPALKGFYFSLNNEVIFARSVFLKAQPSVAYSSMDGNLWLSLTLDFLSGRRVTYSYFVFARLLRGNPGWDVIFGGTGFSPYVGMILEGQKLSFSYVFWVSQYFVKHNLGVAYAF